MKILIAISSLSQYEDNHKSMRDTWLPEASNLGMDYRFFVEHVDRPVRPFAGELPAYKPDSMAVEGSMTDRLKFKLQWAYERGYDYVFSCYPDTYARPERMLTCGFDHHDYFGNVYCYPGGKAYCQGGAGYLVSRRVMEAVAKNHTSYPNDDCWLGDAMYRAGIPATHSEDFKQWAGSPAKSNTIVTSHLSYASNALEVPYTAKFMYDEHKKWMDSV